jgi:hypothetical protein
MEYVRISLSHLTVVVVDGCKLMLLVKYIGQSVQARAKVSFAGVCGPAAGLAFCVHRLGQGA